MDGHLEIYDRNGNIILNLKDILCRTIDRIYVREIPNRRHTIVVNGVQNGETLWVAVMGQYLVAEVNGNTITWSFSMSEETYQIERQMKDITYEGYLVYGVH